MIKLRDLRKVLAINVDIYDTKGHLLFENIWIDISPYSKAHNYVNHNLDKYNNYIVNEIEVDDDSYVKITIKEGNINA